MVQNSSKEAVESALRHAISWLSPLDEESIKRLLIDLDLVTASPYSNDEDFTRKMLIYVERLSIFPATSVVSAIKGWNGDFFPAVGKLERLILSDEVIISLRLKIRAMCAYLAEFDTSGADKKPPLTGHPGDDTTPFEEDA